MIDNAIYVWNHVQSCHHNLLFLQPSTSKLYEILITFFIKKDN